jgi:uroporphyrinogen III methyltransferase/synthase
MHWGTKPEQETVTGTLETIVARTQARGLGPPAVLVVGDVVRLRDRLNWFERRPLFGKRILVTRTREQAGRFGELLEAQGAEVVEVPLIEIVPPTSWDPLDHTIKHLEIYRWVIFTSANGVDAFFRRLRELRQDARRLGAAQICAIGSATADALERYAVIADLVPAEFRAEGIIEALKPYDLTGAKILLPRAEVARDVLPKDLEQRGATVDVVPVYRTVQSSTAGDILKPLLRDRKIDLVTFTSSSTVTNFVEVLAQEDLKVICDGVRVACIGPITQETAERFGLPIDVVPERYTIPSLVDAIVQYYRSSGVG